MKTALLYLVCVLPLVSGCFGSGCDGGGPTFDTCINPAAAALDSLELVRLDTSGAHQPLADNDVIPYTFGGQGSPMIDIHLRMTGNVPSCIAQLSEVRTLDGELLESDSSPYNTYAQGDGSFTTKEIFLVMNQDYFGNLVKVVATVAGRTAERRIFIDSNTVADATPLAPDATDSDALSADAQVTDAQVTDAQVMDAPVTDAPVTDAQVMDAMTSP